MINFYRTIEYGITNNKFLLLSNSLNFDMTWDLRGIGVGVFNM